METAHQLLAIAEEVERLSAEMRGWEDTAMEPETRQWADMLARRSET